MSNQKDKETYQEENKKIKEAAGGEAVILLHNWKAKVRRIKIYKICLIVVLTVSCFALAGTLYYYVDSTIPSVIHVRAGQEQSFQLGIPAKARIVSVSENGKSNIPAEEIDIDLSKSVTMKMSETSCCNMQVKLFGLIPMKQIDIQVIKDTELIPVGKPIGIYVETDGVLVIGTGEFKGQNGLNYSPGKNIVKSGDYILKVNGEAVTKKNDLISKVKAGDGNPITLSIKRDETLLDVSIKPERDSSGEYKIGVWVRDNAQGVGTMTYIDSEGRFGALGHGINDVDTSTLMQMIGGTLYETNIVDIKKGAVGNPGEMTGMIIYTDEHILGNITENSARGIFGNCNAKALSMGGQQPLEIGLKQEIKKGYAQMLCSVRGEPELFDIEITQLHLDHDNINRGIELKITDSELLEIAGGIVQGMSGSPIIQDGKIIGAVTHVLVQDATKGYGIFIENMLER